MGQHRHSAKEILRGAALAAVLILPTVAQTWPLAASAEPHGDWVTGPTKNYGGHAVRVNDVAANLTVVVGNGPIGVQLAGMKDRLQDITVRQDGDTVRIDGPSHRDVWNWNDWFNFSHNEHNNAQGLIIKVTLPQGTPLTVDGLVGDAQVGDTLGPLNFEVISSRSQIGHVRDAKLSLAGSGDLQVAEVAGKLSLDIAGSGRIRVGRSGPIKADLAGNGDVSAGDVQGGLKLDIAGSGNFSAQSVHGPVKVDIAGSGSVKIAGGEANPLHLDIMGSGNFDLAGNAVDPHLEVMGSGQVRLKSYTGQLHSSGNVHLRVNGQAVKTKDDDDDDD